MRQFRAFQWPRIAGSHGVNEHQIRNIQNRVFIILDHNRELRRLSIIIARNAARPEKSHVHPLRTGSRPAVENKCQGAVRCARAVSGARVIRYALSSFRRIGCKENLTLLACSLHHHCACGRCIIQLLPADHCAVLGCDDVVFRRRSGRRAALKRCCCCLFVIVYITHYTNFSLYINLVGMLLSHIVIIHLQGFQIICGVAQEQTTPEVTCCQGQTTPEVAC